MREKIKNITFYPIRPTAKGLIGFSSLLYNSEIHLDCIAVYLRPEGGRVRTLFPQRTLPNGKVSNVYYPIDKCLTEEINEAVYKKINEITK